MKVPFILPLLITRPVLLIVLRFCLVACQIWPSTLCTFSVRWSKDAMLGVYCRWRPSGSLCSISCHHLGAIYERSEEERWVCVMDYHHWKLSPTVLTSLSSWVLLLRSPATSPWVVTDCQTILRATDKFLIRAYKNFSSVSALKCPSSAWNFHSSGSLKPEIYSSNSCLILSKTST